MRRRICVVVGVALSGLPLALGITAAPAAGKLRVTKVAAGKPKVIEVTCATNTGITIAAGDTAVVPPAQHGAEYGTTACAEPLGRGVQEDRFRVPDSGDTVASYTMYFATGSIHGKYDLTPQGGSFGGPGFTEVDSLGTMTVTGGTGRFRGAKGIGTMKCKSLDGIHTACTDKLKLRKAH